VTSRKPPRSKSVAIYPGSFDPVTHGHLDLISRGARIFDHLIVAILKNPEKKPLFGLAQRMRLLRAAVKEHSRVEVESCSGLLGENARQREASGLIRGLRAGSVFEY
jgi:pantetheine-phosphate adenylyltransferase